MTDVHIDTSQNKQPNLINILSRRASQLEVYASKELAEVLPPLYVIDTNIHATSTWNNFLKASVGGFSIPFPLMTFGNGYFVLWKERDDFE